MSNAVIDLLQNYLDEFDEFINTKGKTVEKTRTTTEDAALLDISTGTLSQLRNGKIEISDRVIEKIAKKIGGNDPSREREVKRELEEARKSAAVVSAAASAATALENFHEFFKTAPGIKRLICYGYRDIPQSRDQGKYPEYTNKSSAVIRGGLSCAVFNFFGPLEKIKKKVFAAYENNDAEAVDRWNYVYRIASGVHEVFQKTRKAVDENPAEPGYNKGQIILYEATEVPMFPNCGVQSRLFYSHQITEISEIRIVQMIQEKDQELFVECGSEPTFQTAVAAQFDPIINYWLKNGKLPTEEAELKDYLEKGEKCYWKIHTGAIPS